jgi:hypothetical protein
MRRIVLLLLLSLGLSIGCGDSKRPANLLETTGGQAGSGGNGGEAGLAGGGVGGDTGGTAGGGVAGTATGGTTVVNQPGAPVVTFISPASALDPNAAGVVTTENVTVICKATVAPQPGSTVNAASATITMFQNDVKIEKNETSSLMVSGARQTEFALTDASGIKSGIVVFKCSAEDYSSPALVGSAKELKLLVDRGPVVAIVSPSSQQTVALSEGVDVEFNVTPDPIADNDTKDAIDSVIVKINNKEVTVSESTPGSGHYKARVALNDPNLFSAGDTPTGDTTLQILVKNKRGTQVQRNVTFVVDSTPPTIKILSPAEGKSTIVGKSATIQFTVEDDGAGVNETTVGVRINAGQMFYYSTNQAARWSRDSAGGSTYYFTFTDADFAPNLTQVTLNFYASDKVQNSISPGATRALFLDTIPPYVSLDPPTVRVTYFNEIDDANVCSAAFDPLGDAINDLSVDNGVDVFRALAWDMTNEPRDPNLIRYYSSVNNDSVRIYMGENLDEPLLVDTDGDGYCDNVDVGTGDNRKVALKLGEIRRMGDPPAPLYTTPEALSLADDTRYGPAPDIGTTCQRENYNPSSTWPFLCRSTSDMVRSINHSVDTTTPISAIFGNEPTGDTSTIGCTGTYWAYYGAMKRALTDGWVCFVGVAEDNVGNRGVSAPLRICYDDPATPAVPTCAQNVQTRDITVHAQWASYIRGSLPSEVFRTLSAETPPTCIKNNCKLKTVPFNRILTNQKY